MAKNKHLTLSNRYIIEDMLQKNASFVEIAKVLNKDPSTISKEIRNHLVSQKTRTTLSHYNACIHQKSCNRFHICDRYPVDCRGRKPCKICSYCNFVCPDFEQNFCKKLSKPPYCCNACPSRLECRMEKKFYYALQANNAYRDTLSESRSGIALSEGEVNALDEFVAPLILKGQSPHHICVTNPDSVMVSERTIYRYIDANVLSSKNLDLPRKVRYRPRKKRKPMKIDKSCRIGRDYHDFLAFIEDSPGAQVVELDTVEGKKGGPCLLTIHFVKAEFMLAFIRDRNDSASVISIFEWLFDLLGAIKFHALFHVCLTDNGSEFSNPKAIEFDADGSRRAHVFYCDPSASFQKGSAECCHEMIRRFIPKGKDMSPYSQEDISLMMNHINSYTRESLGNKTAYDTFAFLYGQEVLDLLGCYKIDPLDVTLNKSIFRKDGQS